MGKLKEKFLGVENVESWREVETAALLGLPDERSLKRTSLEAVAALPVGTAISSEITISSEGAISILLKQLGLGWDGDVFPPLLGLAAPSIAPGSRIMMGNGRRSVGREFAIFPQWCTLSNAKRVLRPMLRDEEWCLQTPKPPATWPWDIKRALATLMKIRATAMGRAGRRDRLPVRVYIDEFQNCRGDSLQSLLAEGRKFGVSLALANQSLGQIGGTENRSIGSATLANVGNLITFRLGAVDAIKLAPWLDEPERWRELCQLPDFTMNARLLENGHPVQFQRLRFGGATGSNGSTDT